MRKLKTISDIRAFFHQYDVPTYFVSATPFNLQGLEEWVGDFTFINYIDCFDGKHPSVFVPSKKPHEPFESIEDIVNTHLQRKGKGSNQFVAWTLQVPSRPWGSQA